MKKINVFVIIQDHLMTLYDDRTQKVSWIDIGIFYFFPIALSGIFYLMPFRIPDGSPSALIAVFSVFGALLFSAQIALYGLSPKKPQKLDDEITNARNLKDYEREKKFFGDVNANVSYLILISCFSLLAFLVLMVLDYSDRIEGTFLVFSVSHFFLTLLMLIKRTHVAFSLKHASD